MSSPSPSSPLDFAIALGLRGWSALGQHELLQQLGSLAVVQSPSAHITLCNRRRAVDNRAPRHSLIDRAKHFLSLQYIQISFY